MKDHINNDIKSAYYRIVTFGYTCCSCCIQWRIYGEGWKVEIWKFYSLTAARIVANA